MQPDNPKLTAYVLDELSATDRNAVDSELARNPELAAEAEGLRRTADQLRRAFATAESPALSAEARRAILSAGVVPVSAAGRSETAAVASRSESTVVPGKLEPVGSRTREKEPMIVRLRRTFRWAACFAVLIGATYLLGLAAWKDTHPQALIALANSKNFSLTDSSNRLRSTEIRLDLVPKGSTMYEASLGLAAPTSNSPATAEQMQRLGNVTYSTTDSLDTEGMASIDSAFTSPTAGGFLMLERDGDVTVKQYVSPELQADLATATRTTGAQFYGFTPNASLASTVDRADHSAPAETEWRGYISPSHPATVPGVLRDSAKSRKRRIDFSLNTDNLTGTAGDDEFSAPLQFIESAGQEVPADPNVSFDSRVVTRESYSPITDNPFVFASKEPVSTFSIDVDTASYSNIRRHLLAGQLPPKDAVRIEEMINAFRYDYPEPTAERPFSVNAEVGECPWSPAHRLVRVGLQGYQVDPKDRPPLNLVFLIDVSGSMQAADKLPLVRDSLKVLLEQLWAEDRVGIVTYAGESAIALPSTPGTRYDEILAAIDGLSSGGSTNGEAGIRDAYLMAEDNFIEGGVNRVMLCTDGDFNVGVSDDNELVDLIRVNATSGVFLTVLGFGTGNLKDGKLEALADKGNGHYAYIDDLVEAKRVLGDEAGATLQTIAKDVKIQVQFNPARVQSYRLIGYENRVMAAQDFADDAKDAGEIGAGHSVTALYEVVPASGETLAGDRSAEGELSADYADGADYLNPRKVSAVDELQQRAVENAEAMDADAEDNDAPLAESEDAPPAVGNNDPLAENDGAATADAGSDSIASLPADALLLLRLRYKAPDGAVSQLIETPVIDGGAYMEQMPRDFLFAASVASFGMLLRESPHVGEWSFEAAEELARSGIGDDPSGYRTEFVQLVRRAIEIRAAQTAP